MPVPCQTVSSSSQTPSYINKLYNYSLTQGKSTLYYQNTIKSKPLDNSVLKQNFEYLNLVQSLKKSNSYFYNQCSFLLDSFILKYIYARLINNPDSLLYANLINVLMFNAKAYSQWLETKENISGIYLILNIESNIGYIGKSINIINRFNNHQKQLLTNSHFNYNLQKAYLSYQSNQEKGNNVTTNPDLEQNKFNNFNLLFGPFMFLLLETGLVSEAERTLSEKNYITNWPGLLYNIKDNTHRKCFDIDIELSNTPDSL
jgi:hypothetical protein